MTDPRTLLSDEDVCFRYRLVTAVLALELGGTARSAAIRAVADATHVDEQGAPRQVSAKTLRRWLAAYTGRGLAGLCRRCASSIPCSGPGTGNLPDANTVCPFIPADRPVPPFRDAKRSVCPCDGDASCPGGPLA